MTDKATKLCPDLVYRFLQWFALFFTILAFFVDSIFEIWNGMKAIAISPSNLLTDYFEIGGLGATLLNAGLLTFLSLFILRKHEHHFSPNTVLTIMLLAGYAFWGKNLFNSLPIMVGLVTYLKKEHDESQIDIAAGLLGTALAPAVSIVFFYSDSWSMKTMALLLGFLIGYTIVPIFKKVRDYTKGLNLYNMGFAAGVASIGVNFIVKRMLNIPVPLSKSEALHGNEIFYVLVTLFMVIFLYGVYIFFAHHFMGIKKGKVIIGFNHHRFSLKDTMRIFRFSIYGWLGILIVRLFEGQLNGPVAGTILIFSGFSMYHFHFKDYFFPAIGVVASYALFYPEASITTKLIAVLFVSTMAPFSKKYGILLGFFSGLFFPIISRQLYVLHDGINLYNSGFAGGVTAIVLSFIYLQIQRIPLLNKLLEQKYPAWNAKFFKKGVIYLKKIPLNHRIEIVPNKP